MKDRGDQGEQLLDDKGQATIVFRNDLQIKVPFTDVETMVAEYVNEARYRQADQQAVERIEQKAREFYSSYQPGDEIWTYLCGSALAMRGGLVLLRNGRIHNWWCQVMS